MMTNGLTKQWMRSDTMAFMNALVPLSSSSVLNMYVNMKKVSVKEEIARMIIPMLAGTRFLFLAFFLSISVVAMF